MSADFITAFATLFVMIDPIGLTPLFAALTAGASFRQRVIISLRAILVAAAILTLFGLAGDALLEAVGISLPAFRIAGGIMLFLLAIDMLFEKRTERREKRTEAESHSDPSVFPLATPLIAGPGAMAAMILLTSAHPGDGLAQAMAFLGMATVLAICFVVFLATGPIERAIGPTGIKVLTRLFGTLLGALAVQFVLDGLAEFWSIQV
ncbi:MAG: MarC family protein [Pseudomonadota bacterium]